MPDNPNNQEDYNNQSGYDAQPEHETHTAALVFLVLATIIISFVALTWDTSLPTIEDDPVATTTEPAAEGTHGSIVPQRAVETTDTNSLTGFPQDLYINEDTIIDNKMAPAGEGDQYMVAFTEERSISELQSEYKTYLENSDFSIHQEMEDEYGAKLAASSAGQQLTISMTENGSVVRVMLDYVTSN